MLYAERTRHDLYLYIMRMKKVAAYTGEHIDRKILSAGGERREGENTMKWMENEKIREVEG